MRRLSSLRPAVSTAADAYLLLTRGPPAGRGQALESNGAVGSAEVTRHLIEDHDRIAQAMNDVVVHRIFAAGLDLQAALGLTGDHKGAARSGTPSTSWTTPSGTSGTSFSTAATRSAVIPAARGDTQSRLITPPPSAADGQALAMAVSCRQPFLNAQAFDRANVPAKETTRSADPRPFQDRLWVALAVRGRG